MALVRIIKWTARWLTVVGLVLLAVLFAGKALALEADDLAGEWKGSDNKIHRITIEGYSKIVLCRPVANVSGGTRLYRGDFAFGNFKLVSKPRNIGALNNKLPAELRRQLIDKGVSYGANVTIADQGRRLVVQYIDGEVTWERTDPTKIYKITPIDGPKVTLTHVITENTVIEIAKGKAERAIDALLHHNKGQARLHINAAAELIEAFGWDSDGRPIRTLGYYIRDKDTADLQLRELKRLIGWWRELDIFELKLKRWHHNKLVKIRPEILEHLVWVRDLARLRVKLHWLRSRLRYPRAAATGVRDVDEMEKIFWEAYQYKQITTVDYEAYMKWPVSLKKALAVLAKAKKTADRPKSEPKISGDPASSTGPGC